MKKRLLAMLLAVVLAMSLLPVSAFAKGEGGTKGYDHIDVKVDGKYSISVNGTSYEMNGTIDKNYLVVKIGTTEYSFENASVRTESGQSEYHRTVNTNFKDSVIYKPSDSFQPDNVTVSFRMYFDSVNEAIQDLFSTAIVNGVTKYYVDVTDYKYTGVNECTGGKGMRSDGNTGDPSGLDLYINAAGMGAAVTQGKLAIQKIVIDEEQKVIADSGAKFSYTLEKNNTDDGTKTLVKFAYNTETETYTYAENGTVDKVQVAAGATVMLEGLPVGLYTVTEMQQAGYTVIDADGNVGAGYSYDYTVEDKADSDIPTAVFTNMKLTNSAAISIAKTSAGLPSGSSYPNPEITIYKENADAADSWVSVWSGTLTANGDRVYLTVLLGKGTYKIEETGTDFTDYQCSATLSAKIGEQDQTVSGMQFTIGDTDVGQRIDLTVNNLYTKLPETGSLTISKSFAGNGEEIARAQFEKPGETISFTIENADGTEVGTVTLPQEKTVDGATTYIWSATVDGLAPGNYTVTESGASVDGYKLETTGTSAAVTAGSTTDMTVTNTYTKYEPNIFVTKELVSIDGVPAGEDNKVAGEGQEIVWKIIVTNSGMADAENLTLTDLLNDEENSGVKIKDAEGNAYTGESFAVPAKVNDTDGKVEFTATYQVTNADAGKTLINKVTVGGKESPADPAYTFVKKVVTSGKVSELPEEVTNTLAANKLTPTYPASENDPVYLNKDESVTLLYAITVTGEADTAYTITDADAVFVVGSATGKIPESGTATVYVAKTFTENAISDTGKVTNTAVLTVGNETDTATEETDVIDIDVVKTVAAVGEKQVTDQNNIPMAQKDDVITWTITVTNNSKVAVSGLKLTDGLTGAAVKDTGGNDALAEDYSFDLAANESAAFTATYTVTEADVGTEIVNVAAVKNNDNVVEEGESEGVSAVGVTKAVVLKSDTNIPSEAQNINGVTYPESTTTTITLASDQTVTLMYAITVTGVEGVTYTVNDAGTTLVTTVNGTASKNTDGRYMVAIPIDADDGDTVGSVVIYVTRTFGYDQIQNNLLSNTVTLRNPNGEDITATATTPADKDASPSNPPPTTGGGGSSKPPVLNTEDHYGYIVGYPDGTVRPEGNITRAEVATIFFRMLTDESRAECWSQTNSYSDVSEGQWFNAAISTLSNAGIINGYSDGTFRPNGNITRAEFAAIASRFFEYAGADGESPFSDVSDDAWYYEYVMAASDMGLITGYPDGTFGPKKSITRAEAVTIVNRTLERAPDADHFLDDMITWPDNTEDAWYYEAMQEATNSHEYQKKTESGSTYEIWTKILPVRDWVAYEKEWSDANSASGGEVMR